MLNGLVPARVGSPISEGERWSSLLRNPIVLSEGQLAPRRSHRPPLRGYTPVRSGQERWDGYQLQRALEEVLAQAAAPQQENSPGW